MATHPQKEKLPAPTNATANPSTMELTFDFLTARTFGIHIVDSTKNIIVEHDKIDRVPADGKVKINLISLEHIYPYMAGKYTLSVKSIAAKDEAHSNSEPVKVEFEMTGEQAAIANTRLNIKKILELQAALEKVTKEHGDKLKLFPDLAQTIKDLQGLIAGGNTKLAEFEALETGVNAALDELRGLKNQAAADLRELEEALEKAKKIKPAKEAATGKTATKSSTHQHDVLKLMPIFVLFVLILVALIIGGMLGETKILAPNGVNGVQPAVVPAIVPPVTNTAGTVQPTPVQPPIPNVDNNTIPPTPTPPVPSHKGSVFNNAVRTVCVPPEGHEYDRTWTDMIQPGEVVKYLFRPGFVVKEDFDTSQMHGRRIALDLARSTEQVFADKGIQMSLWSGIDEPQPITFEITPIR